MATSGTISSTIFTTRKVIERASFRAGLVAEKLTPEHVETATDSLYLLLSDLANQGASLWCIEKLILPMYEGNGSIPCGDGTVDILNANLRTLAEVTGTNTDTSTRRTIAFDTATTVTTVGLLWSAASAPLEFSRSDDGVTFTVIQTETNPGSISGEWNWYDLDSAVAALYFRVRATSGTLDYDTLFTGNNPTEITLARINRDDWFSIPNKVFLSQRPTEYWFDRQIPQPFMRLWPVPDATASASYQITVLRRRYIEDVGTLTDTLDIPQRWFEAVTAMLAAKLVIEFPDADIKRSPMLDQKAQAALWNAQQEEYDNSPINLMPDFSCYSA